MIGQTVAQYRILETLGAGGMGEVYLALDTKLDRQVALKFLPRHFSIEPEARARFEREARALAALNHPNIVTVFDVSAHDGQPYIAMEYVNGRSAQEHAAKAGADQILDVAIQLAEGLAAAHKAGIVHRDIKSDNVVVTADGRVKIMDFGLALWRGGEQITRAGSTVGTAAYMSPEQVQGGAVDQRTDLWSFGVVLYEMLCGRRPFTGEHTAALTYAITSTTPEPLARYKSDVSNVWQRIVTKCLAKHPDERYQSAADIAADLRALKTASTIHAATRPPSRTRARVVAGATIVVLLAAAAVLMSRLVRTTDDAATAPERIMLAVLPFENLGSDEQEYFADGITEEITARLARLHGLGVISRTSAIQYKKSTKPMQTIGEELGVDYILEGTIRWDRSGETDQVRITPQLIHVKDDTHLWADSYERPLTQVFALQSEIAGQVAAALNVTLLEPERRALESVPTQNLEAYDLYLQATDYLNQPYEDQSNRLARELLRRAIALDSGFALAYAQLSHAYAIRYWWGMDLSHEMRDSIRAYSDRALQLDPDLAEGHIARGLYYYWGFRDYAQALAELRLGEDAHPAGTSMLIGAISRRQGRWTESEKYLRRAAELSPRDGRWAMEYGYTLLLMRRYADAARWFDRTVVLLPRFAMGYDARGWARLGGDGDLTQAEVELRSAASAVPGRLDYSLAQIREWKRDYDSARALATMDAVMRAYGADSVTYYMFQARLGMHQQRDSLRLAYADSAITLLQRRVAQYPDNAEQHARLAYTLGMRGRHDEALAAAQRAAELVPLSRDAVDGSGYVRTLAEVYTMMGEHDRAIDLLDELLSIPSLLSFHDLRLNPFWDPLRDDPRFQALIDRGHVVF